MKHCINKLFFLLMVCMASPQKGYATAEDDLALIAQLAPEKNHPNLSVLCEKLQKKEPLSQSLIENGCVEAFECLNQEQNKLSKHEIEQFAHSVEAAYDELLEQVTTEDLATKATKKIFSQVVVRQQLSSGSLYVGGDTIINHNLRVNNDLTVQGDQIIEGNLIVQGATIFSGTQVTLSGNQTINGNLTVVGNTTTNGIQSTGTNVLTGPTNINTSGTAATNIGNCPNSTTNISGTTNINTTGSCATNIGNSASNITIQGTQHSIGDTFMSAATGTVLTITGNAGSPAVNITGGGAAGALRLVGNQPAVITDLFLTIDPITGIVHQGSGSSTGGIVNGCQPGPLTIGTTNGTSLSLNTGTGVCNQRVLIDANGGVTIQTPAGGETGLTIAGGGASIAGTTNINTTGAAATQIGTGGTGALYLGNSTGNIFFPTDLAGSAFGDEFLVIDPTSGRVRLDVGTDMPGAIVNGGQFGPLTIGTSNATGLSLVTSGSNNTRLAIDSAGAVTIAAPTAGTGLTIAGGGESVTGTTTINTTGAATTTIGNASSTTTVTGPANINTTGAAATTIGNASSTTTITGPANINTSGTATTNIGTAGGATNVGSSASTNTIQGTNNVIGNTFMSAATGVVLTVTGNATNPSTVLVGSSSTTAPALKLINNPAGINTDFFLTIDSTGVVKQTTSSVQSGFIINGGQPGPLTIGTTDATTMSFITNNLQRIGIDSAGAVTIATPTAGTGLTIAGGGESVTGTTTINTTGAATTTIGNASSTTTVTGPANINTTGAAATTIGNTSSTTTITGPANINTSGTATTNIGTAGGATNIGSSASTNTVQGTNNVIGNTFMSATTGVVLTVTGNATNPSTVLVGSSSTTAPALKLINNPAGVNTDFFLTIDSTGVVKQTASSVQSGFIINGGQPGPLTIGTTDATTMSFITNNLQRIGIDSAGAVTIAAPTAGTGLTIAGGGESVTGTTTINTTGAATTTIGNASSTTTVTGPANINTTGAAATTIGNASSTTTITGPANINTSGTATTNIGTAGGATNVGSSASNNTVQGTNNVIGNTFMSAATGVVLTVTGNATNPSTVLVGNSSTTAPALKLINNPASFSGNLILQIDPLTGTVTQGTINTGTANVILNGGQPGPLTIGTTDATTMSFITNNAQRIGIDGTTGLVTVANGETITTGGLTINAGGASVAGGITATSGNITASSGNISAASGNILGNSLTITTTATICSLNVTCGATITTSTVVIDGTLKVINGDILLGDANADGSSGVLKLGVDPIFLYNTGTSNFFAGDYTAGMPNPATLTGANNISIGTQANSTLTISSQNISIGSNSRAGSPTSTGVNNCIALGLNATATGNVSTAIGSSASAKGETSVAIGIVTQANGAGSIALGGSSQANASFTVALGSSSAASATYATALGSFAVASNSNSIAIGGGLSGVTNGATASGLNAIAIGSYDATNVISPALASNTRSIAIGTGAVASGISSLALGDATNATGLNSISMGTGTSSSTNGIAIGEGVTVLGDNGIALGTSATATGSSAAIAIGLSSQAHNIRTVALGSGAAATGVESTALGYISAASGAQAAAIGVNAQALAASSVAFGQNAIVNSGGTNAIAIGLNANNLGNPAGANSIAIGFNSQAYNTNSVALGANAISSQASGIVLGDSTSSAVAVGIGTNTPAGKLAVVGNTTSPAILSTGNSTTTAPALKLINNPAGINTDFLLTIDSTGVVKQTPSTIQSGFIVNGGQPGPLTIGTTDATTMSFITNNLQRIGINSAGAVTIAAPTAGTGLTIAGGGEIITAGVLTVPAGSVSAPSYSFNGNTTTGMYSPGANQLALVTSNTARLIIDANGSVVAYSSYDLLVTASADQPIDNQGVGYPTFPATAIRFGSTIFDPSSSFSGGTTFTVPRTGLYAISSSLTLETSTVTGPQYIIGISINGATTTYNANAISPNFAVAPSAETESVFHIVRLNQGDSVQIQVASGSPNTRVKGTSSFIVGTQSANSSLNIYYISAF